MGWQHPSPWSSCDPAPLAIWLFIASLSCPLFALASWKWSMSLFVLFPLNPQGPHRAWHIVDVQSTPINE